MPIQEDKEGGDEQSEGKTADETDTPALPDESALAKTAEDEKGDAASESGDDVHGEPGEQPSEAMAPTQLGAKRFVYAAYFAGGIGIAFITSKALTVGWYNLQRWKPLVGDPRDEIVMPLSALIGLGAAIYYWYRTRARQLAEEVAAEMSKVTWPSRTEVQNGTFVVIVTTVLSTVFFALMDKFWGFVTNLVYGGT
jgi:preprotein translocase subunit SecE